MVAHPRVCYFFVNSTVHLSLDRNKNILVDELQ